MAASINELVHARRAVRLRIAGEARYVPVEYAARYRDALGSPLPPGLAELFLEPVPDPLARFLRRYARTHGPFTTAEFCARYGIADRRKWKPCCALCTAESRLLEGEFRPGGMHREWCDPDVLQQVRRKSLARLRREVVPAEQHVSRASSRAGREQPCRAKVWTRCSTLWRSLQGADLIASDLEREILPARVADYQPADLDALLASGEWSGLAANRWAIAMAAFRSISPNFCSCSRRRKLEERPFRTSRAYPGISSAEGASFQATIHQAVGGGFPNETTDALWELVWAGLITNDTFRPIRGSLLSRRKVNAPGAAAANQRPGSPGFL